MMKLILFLIALQLTACTPSYDYEISRYKGNFRYFSHIAEFYDCKSMQKHYLGSEGVLDELIEEYKKLNLKEKDDVYIRVEGYYREEEQMDGVDPIEVFVPTKIVELDTSRSCKRPYRVGL